MTQRISIRLLWFGFLAITLATRTGAAQKGGGAVFAASNGKGQISLMWFPPTGQWPVGGWQISDSTGKALTPRIAMGASDALQPLSVEDRDTIARLPNAIKNQDGGKQSQQLFAILGLRAFSDPAIARALGLSWTLTNVPSGSRGYTITGYDNGGQATVKLSSAPLDASQATPAAPAPDGMNARSERDGVALFWNPPTDNHQLPVIAYFIQRKAEGESLAPVTPKPIVTGTTWDAKKPIYLDHDAPGNLIVTYNVYAVDLFGRRSEATEVSIFHLDYAAMQPPEPVKATANAGKVMVRWQGEKKQGLAGYIVERAMLHEGPFEALTPQALPPGTGQYEDDSVRGGSVYYYRVRAVNSRGDLGAPSLAAAVQPMNTTPPSKVVGVAVVVGKTRARLTWKPITTPIAGYFVERSVDAGTAGVDHWVRLNSHVNPEPRYDDYFGLSSNAVLKYRVVAVAFDNAEGQASNPVQITLADRSLPFPPTITAASGADGKAAINFAPAPPEEKNAQFLVLRSGRANDQGLVIGDPLPATSRQFTDLYVSPGETYYYRLVAVDKNGNRSDPTNPVLVHVGAPQIAKPAPLTAKWNDGAAPSVALNFAAPPAGLLTIVERQNKVGGSWVKIAGPMPGNSAMDRTPVKGASYRITYVAANGLAGPSSDAATAQ